MVEAVKLSTADLPARERCEWLREVIGREYANVEITPPADDTLFNEMTIYPWKDLRLSSIRSNAIALERSPKEPSRNSHDACFAVVLLSGAYMLEQGGREVVLRPGDMTLYDATRPHCIFCPQSFSKLIVSIPRPILKDRGAGVEDRLARLIPGNEGIGSVIVSFLRSAAAHAAEMRGSEFLSLSDHCLDLTGLALASASADKVPKSRHRAMLLERVKEFVERNLGDPNMSAASVARGVGISSR